jgi:agmatine deiminase
MPNKASTNVSTPKALGFRMPAEWEPHAATWIAWPHNPTDWPGKFPPIPWAYAEIVRYLARVERVCILVNDVGARKKATEVLRKCHVNLDAVQFYLWPTNRVWTRDSGPIFVRDTKGKVAITNWHFNAWAKYPDWKLDDQIPGRVAKTLQLEQWKPETIVNAKPRRLVLEGGSIDVNGAGCLLTTEECLLSEVQQRNPGVAR